MNLEAVRMQMVRHRGWLLAIAVTTLVVVAAILATSVFGEARQLAAGAPPSVSAEASPSIAPHSHAPTPEATAAPQPTSLATPEPTAVPTPAPTPDPAARWTPAATFSDDEGLFGVMDLTVWNGTFVAVGTTWVDGNPRPLMWQSADGRSWSQAALDLGAGVRIEVVAVLDDGSLMVLGTVGGSAEYWSDPERAAAWSSSDGVTWTPVDLPFGAGAVGTYFQFATGPEGFLVTTSDDIWHSADGFSWQAVYDAPRGTMVYGPVAGDEGWIVKRGNASLGTTTLLVSGDAAIWHEVDLGYVATVSSVAGDWLATRQTDDWQRTEVLRSANGLDWGVIFDLQDLTPPAGSEDSLDSAGLVGATLTGTDEVLLMSPWLGGHCGFMPAGGWGAWWSNDGADWVPAEIGGDAVVTHATEIGDITVLAGYLANGGGVTFWISAG